MKNLAFLSVRVGTALLVYLCHLPPGRRWQRRHHAQSVIQTVEAYDDLVPKGYDHVMPASIVTEVRRGE
jgi:hypothetical protein